MMTGSFHRISLLCLTLTLAAMWSGCAQRSAEEAAILEHKETYYFDAELAFAIEYPSAWKVVRGDGGEPESCTVRWQSPLDQGRAEPVARLVVIACPVARWPGGLGEMREGFLATNPTLNLTEEKGVELPGGKGLMLVGTDPLRTCMTTFLVSASRGYMVSFSAPSVEFENYRPLFAEMLESFQPQPER